MELLFLKGNGENALGVLVCRYLSSKCVQPVLMCCLEWYGLTTYAVIMVRFLEIWGFKESLDLKIYT